MRKETVLGVLVLGVLCVAAGFIAVATQTSFNASGGLPRQVALAGDEGGSSKPFSCRLLGDEGGPGKPFNVNSSKT